MVIRTQCVATAENHPSDLNREKATVIKGKYYD